MQSKHFITIITVFLVLVCASFTDAANICQSCMDDVIHAYPSCNGVDTHVQAGDFNKLSNKEKQCICNVSQNSTALLKCQPLCPDLSTVTSQFDAIYSVYCANTQYANGGTASNGSRSVASVSAAFAVFFAMVISAVAMVVA